MPCREKNSTPMEIMISGELGSENLQLYDKLLEIEPGGECIFYFDSPGGSSYTALGMVGLIRLRGLRITGIVVGECSSSAILVFASCKKRFITPYSVMLFHSMKWESEESIKLDEAAEWTRHFRSLEKDLDLLLADMLGMSLEKIKNLCNPGRYLTGKEIQDSQIAQMIPLERINPGLCRF